MTQIDERKCQAHLLTSSDGGPERWTCPKCGSNIAGPCNQIDERKVEEAVADLKEALETHLGGCLGKEHKDESITLRPQLQTILAALEARESRIAYLTDGGLEVGQALEEAEAELKAAQASIGELQRAIEKTLAWIEGWDVPAEDGRLPDEEVAMMLHLALSTPTNEG